MLLSDIHTGVFRGKVLLYSGLDHLLLKMTIEGMAQPTALAQTTRVTFSACYGAITWILLTPLSALICC